MIDVLARFADGADGAGWWKCRVLISGHLISDNYMYFKRVTNADIFSFEDTPENKPSQRHIICLLAAGRLYYINGNYRYQTL